MRGRAGSTAWHGLLFGWQAAYEVGAHAALNGGPCTAAAASIRAELTQPPAVHAEAQRELVYQCMKRRAFEAMEVIIKQGEQGDWFYVLDEGELSVTVGEGNPLPLKDVATSDALLLREPPAEDDAASRDILAALAKAGIHCIVPSEALAATPLPGAVALVELRDLEAKLLLRTGEGGGREALGDSGRLAVTVRGDEWSDSKSALHARSRVPDGGAARSPRRKSGVMNRAWISELR